MKSINKLFYISYALVVISDIFNSVPALHNILNVLDVSIIFFLIFIYAQKVISKKTYPTKYQFLLLSFSVFVAISAFLSDNRALLKLPFLLLAGYEINFTKLIKTDFAVRTVSLLSIVFLSTIGFANQTTFDIRSDGFIRNSFGMDHPNTFAFCLAILCADYFYLSSIKHKKISFTPIIFAISTIIFNLLYIDSRTSIFITALLTISYVLHKKIKFKLRAIKPLIKNFFIICLGLSVFATLWYNSLNPTAEALDLLFSRRLFISQMHLNATGISIFGTPLTEIELGITSSLDNAYINLVIRYGLVVAAYFAVLYHMSFYRLIKNESTLLTLFSITFLVYGLSETPMYVPGKNPYILLLAPNQVGREHYGK